MDITAQFEPTVAEIRAALVQNSRRTRAVWWAYAAIGIVGGAILLVTGLGIGGGQSSAGLAAVGVLLLLVGAVFLALVRAFPATTDRIANALCAPIAVHLTADRYSWTMRERNGDHVWELTRVVTSRDAWTLAFTSNKVNLVIPKRVLNAEDTAAFETFLNGRDRKLVKVV
ncbi:YcxB family protein [Hamadaea tsunoensis]|uniref:YcxB family protein n=1 Tax=Hamadaea tsunoensis TaxID=53368 RepID=UPI0004150E17|nr:YcxB family protein [Hamadaea tsunoensis]